jgi:hypothetical protein
MSTAIAESPLHFLDTFWQETTDTGDERGDYIRHWTRQLAVWQHSWESWTQRPLPLVLEAREAFRDTLLADGDLGLDQLRGFLNSIFAHEESSFEPWLRATTERFMLRVRPWFPLWMGYVRWVLDWCKARGYKQVVFLARDSLPFYVIARQLVHDNAMDLHLHLVHASRSVGPSGELDDHLSQTIDWRQPVAAVDSGCYGTIMATLVRYQRQVSGSSSGFAAFFYFSRHPRIFGYMNYLMSGHILAEPGSDLTARNARNFIIYAGDVLEAMPKPYRLLSIELGGRPRVHSQDLVSFVLSKRMLHEIRQFTVDQPDDTTSIAVHAASRLYHSYTTVGIDPLAEHCFLFDRPAPKAVPSRESIRDLEYADLPPQNEIFGAACG